MNLPDFKIRCSCIGQIMTNSRKKGELSKTTKSYIDTWIKEQIYQRKKMVYSKYMDKGNMVEAESIAFASRVLDVDLELEKNEIHFGNNYLTGTPDVITNDCVIDLKNSWDCFTFPLFSSEVPNKDYYYQAQGYMNLTGHKKYKLIYTLMDTPESLIEQEYKYSDQLDFEKFACNYRFNHIDEKYRIKIFEIDYDMKVVESIYERVHECKEYIKNLTK